MGLSYRGLLAKGSAMSELLKIDHLAIIPPLSFEGEKYTARSAVWHPRLNMPIDLYWVDTISKWDGKGGGASARWLNNNAKPSTDGQFGLKLMTSWWDEYKAFREAHAAFTRQLAATAYNAAPPVYRMIRFVTANPKHTYWGYQTGVVTYTGCEGGMKVPGASWDECSDGHGASPALIARLHGKPVYGGQRQGGKLGEMETRPFDTDRDLNHHNCGLYKGVEVAFDFDCRSIEGGEAADAWPLE